MMQAQQHFLKITGAAGTRNPELRVMEEFSISEISSVDKPAQEHALARIMKRAPQQEEIPVKTCTIDELQQGVADLRKRLNAFLEKHKPLEAEMNFTDAVTAIAKRDDCSRMTALSKARKEHPEAFQKYQNEALEKHQAAVLVDDPDIAKASRDFNDTVRMLMQSGKTRTAAMQEARRRNPDEFRRAYARQCV